MRSLLLALLLVPAAAAHAQLRFGATGGVNFARITSEDDEIDMRTGLVAGAVAVWDVRPMVGFEAGLLYSRQGAKGGDDTDGFDVRGELKLTYLQLPLQLRLSLAPERSRFRPFVVAGPALGIKIGCKLVSQVGELKAEISCNDPDVDADIKTADFSMVVGGGVDFGDMALGVRYWHGLTAISDAADSGNAKNRVIALTGTLFFRSDRR